MSLMLIAVLTMGGMGVFFALVLAAVHARLKVEEDPKVSRIEEVLPGINCGACGSPGCRTYAERVAGGTAPTNLCVPGGAEVARAVSEIMGVAVEAVQKRVAVVHCGAHDDQRLRRARYLGVEGCSAQEAIRAGDIACTYGCLGKGDCFRACAFDAIEMRDGLPHISLEQCTACGQCVEACPRNIITLEPYEEPIGLITVACSSQDTGRVVRRICPVGCIACRLCVRTCTHGAFYMNGNLANVHQDKAQGCEEWDTVMAKCPPKCIVKVGGQGMELEEETVEQAVV